MILVFTSTAFTNWVKNHVEITEDASFNPYLTFLFFAMYALVIMFFLCDTDDPVSRAGMSAMRFVGSTLYLIFRLFGF